MILAEPLGSAEEMSAGCCSLAFATLSITSSIQAAVAFEGFATFAEALVVALFACSACLSCWSIGNSKGFVIVT